MLMKVGQQMLRKLGQQMLTKIDRQLFHTIATDARLAGANQQMFLTYTIDYVTPGRFFCLLWYCQSTHYSTHTKCSLYTVIILVLRSKIVRLLLQPNISH